MKTEPKIRRHRLAVARSLAFAILVALLLSSAAPAQAQKNSNFVTVSLNANAKQSLSVTAAPALVNFNLIGAGGVAAGSVPISITTSWNLNPPLTATTYAFFASAAVALTDGAGDNIDSSRVLGSVNGGAFTAFTGVGPFSVNTSVQIFSVRIKGFNRVGSNTDSLNLEIDTTGLLLPAAIYSGLLIIQAQAI